MDTDDQRREQIDQEVGRAVRRLIEETRWSIAIAWWRCCN